MKRLLVFLTVWSLYPLCAQESYMARADRFSSDSLGGLIRNQYVSVQWIGEECRWFHYTSDDADARRYWLVDTRTWRKRPLFDSFSMTRQLAAYADSSRMPTPKELRLYGLEFDSSDPRGFTFDFNKHRLHYDGRNGKLSEKPRQDASRGNLFSRGDYRRSYSADSSYYVTAVGHDLMLFRGDGSDSVRLTHDGERYHSFSTGGNNVVGPEARSSAIGRWMGKSHYYLLVREDKREVEELTLVDNLARPRPKAKSYKFPMPGDEHVVQYDAWLVDADSMCIRKLDIARWPDQKVEVPRFSMIAHTDRYAWLVSRSRTCDSVELCRVDFAAHRVEPIIREVCKPAQNDQQFCFHILNEGRDILWWSERTGYGHYYLYDGNGRLQGAVTSGAYVAGKIERIDTLARTIVYEGYGREPGVNPHYRFYYKTGFNGGEPVLLTPGNGEHSVAFSPDGRFLTDTWSRMDRAPRHQVCDMKGRGRIELEPCDLSELYARGWHEPEVVEVLAADSVTRLYGIVYFPFDREPGRKYPIISNVYPGPHVDLVPQAFTLDDNYNQSLAQLGFVVINFAYRGSGPWRGRDFHTFGYGNLRDYALADDMAAIRQIAARYPCADIERVGIYGHSGGGFMTVAAMLNHPEFYKVGVAASGNHDNNIYSQWWGETFHGVKQTWGKDGKPHFECHIPTNIELADRLAGRLLLITGDMDNNVHPASTARLADALIRARKRFDMTVIPGADHGLGNSYYVNLIRYYFTEHLLGLPQQEIDIVKHN